MTTIKSENGVYELIIPKEYIASKKGDILHIYDEDNGVGAITIHDFRMPFNYTFSMEEELKDFMTSIDEGQRGKNIRVNNCNNYSFAEFISDSEYYWKIWAFYKINYAVFASYCCNNINRSQEIKSVDLIMQSLEISDISMLYQ